MFPFLMVLKKIQTFSCFHCSQSLLPNKKYLGHSVLYIHWSLVSAGVECQQKSVLPPLSTLHFD